MPTNFKKLLRIPQTPEEVVEYFSAASHPLQQFRVLEICYSQPEGWAESLSAQEQIEAHVLVYQKVRPAMLARLRGMAIETLITNN